MKALRNLAGLGKGDSTPASAAEAEADSGVGSPKDGVVARQPSLSTQISARLDVETQMQGNLYKKDTAGSNSWTLRFFVIKDGFLMYYEQQKSPSITFNMHPKGVVPLDGVEIETVRTGPKAGMVSAIRVAHPSFGAKSVLVCARDDTERDRWVAALTASSFVTYTRAVAVAAELEQLKRQLAEAQARASATAASLAHKNEQVIKLVAQNKCMLAGIAAAEGRHGISIDIPASTSVSAPQGRMPPPPAFAPPPRAEEGTAAMPSQPALPPASSAEAAALLAAQFGPRAVATPRSLPSQVAHPVATESQDAADAEAAAPTLSEGSPGKAVPPPPPPFKGFPLPPPPPL